MKLPYKLTRSSKATLRQIGIDTKKNFGDKQAKKYLKDLYEFFSLLAGNPEMGRERAEISKHTRSIPRGSHVIYYQDNAAPLVIFRIRHKNADPEYDTSLSTPINTGTQSKQIKSRPLTSTD